jgi:predicted N-formylglutamate amidohydrolase
MLRDSDAVRVVGAGRTAAPLVLSCEHASERLPEGYALAEADRWLAGTHWMHDLGAEILVEALAKRLECPAVLSVFSRLVVDVNRPPDAPSLIRGEAEGRLIEMNQAVDERERAQRIARFHTPYHDALDRVVGASSAPLVLAIHTFTPVYDGVRRAVELGVLFDRDEGPATRLAEVLRGASFTAVELNEPYSGRQGLIYSADRHARAHGRIALELEVRQDLVVDPDYRARLSVAIETFVEMLA